MGVGIAGGRLGTDINATLVPGRGSNVQPQRIAYLEEMIWEYDAEWAKKELKALKRSGAIRTEVRPNWGIGEGLRGPSGMPHLKADSILGLGTGLDMFLQFLNDQGLCLTPRQKYYRVLIAGGLALGVGAIGMGVGVAVVGSYGVAAAATSSVGAGLVAGLGSEFIVKPLIYSGLGLQ